MGHALVVGGTGMLRGVVLWLAGRGEVVSVVARGRSRLARIAEDARGGPGRVETLDVDYGGDAALRATLNASCAREGPFRTAVCWIHSTAPRAPRVVAEVVAGSPDAPCDYVHVLGSGPVEGERPNSPGPASVPGVRYRRVVLGFVVEGTTSRWLTDEEISGGVIRALGTAEDRTFVGVVEPGDMRP